VATMGVSTSCERSCCSKAVPSSIVEDPLDADTRAAEDEELSRIDGRTPLRPAVNGNDHGSMKVSEKAPLEFQFEAVVQTSPRYVEAYLKESADTVPFKTVLEVELAPAKIEGGETAADRRARAVKLWQKAGRMVMLAKNANSKISIHNKIGSELTGWSRDVALELQKGIAAEGRGQTHPKFRAPERELFDRCRVACGYHPARYFATMGLQDGRIEPNLRLIGGQDAAGRSGSFFFLSPDQQLFAKSCTREDWRQLLRILPAYTEFVEAARERANVRLREEKSSPAVKGFTETLLPRFLGLYKLTPDGEDSKNEPVRVLIMANTFGGAMTISRKYDLKGSTTGRKASKKERAKKSPVYKDIDWVAIEPLLNLNAMNREMFLDTIKRDLLFLAKNMLMDYSLLVGVHDIAEHHSNMYEAMNVVTLRDETRHCYIGIIDVLTPYGMKKRAETFFVGTLVCGRDISCQHPKVYARRFFEFTDTQVFDLDKEPSHRDERP